MDRIGNSAARGVVYAAIIICFAGALLGAEFAGGTGAPNDPYQIATLEQLVAIGSDPNLAQSDFILVADIDVSFPPWSEPVIPAFGGTLDGNGHALQGLVARGTRPLGLFGRITDAGRVMNLRMADVDLTGADAIGALAAFNDGTVQGCTSTGSIVGAGSDAGGLVGSNSGIISGSSSTAEITGYSRVGGLVGRNRGGILANCHSTAIVFGSSSVGGLVGSNEGSLSASYSDSDAVAKSDVGGLVGANAGAISSSYSTGTVTGGNHAGGLAGTNTGTILTSYSIAGVTGEPTTSVTTAGGLVGRAFGLPVPVVADSYFLAPADGGGPDNEIGVPLTFEQMQQRTSFVGWDFWGRQADGMDAHWFMPPDSSPVLVWQTEVTGLQLAPPVAGLPLERAQAALTTAGFVPGSTSYDYDQALPGDLVIHAEPGSVAPIGAAIDLVLSTGTMYDWADNPGDGTEANPYQIQTAGQLESLGDHSELWDSRFVLTADLDMAGRTYATALIAPDTSRATDEFQGTPFTGVFDGQGYTIRNLTIFADDREFVGLFGMVGEAGLIRSLTLRDAIVNILTVSTPVRRSPTTYIGILAGYNEGTISDCVVFDSLLIGRNSGDGLVGVNRGNIIDCHADIALVSVSSSVQR